MPIEQETIKNLFEKIRQTDSVTPPPFTEDFLYKISENELLQMENWFQEALYMKLMMAPFLPEADTKLEHWPADAIRFDFEHENEERVVVAVDAQLYGDHENWETKVEDTYDPSGRFRVREKNGTLRFSIKIPLQSNKTPGRKQTLRLEFKPVAAQHIDHIAEIKAKLLLEQGVQTFSKRGRRITFTNGEFGWLNTDGKGKYWIESDGPSSIVNNLPEGITYIKHEISQVDIENALNPVTPETAKYMRTYADNNQVTSRSSRGEISTKVSDKKKDFVIEMPEEERQKIVLKNQDNIISFLWEMRHHEFASSVEFVGFVDEIATKVNNGLILVPNGTRKWEVKYGRGVLPESICRELLMFSDNMLQKLSEVETEADKVDLAAWVELEIDKHIHPYMDGCGRIAKAISAWILMRFDLPLPDYQSRDHYYNAMNSSDADFVNYYRSACALGKEKWQGN